MTFETKDRLWLIGTGIAIVAVIASVILVLAAFAPEEKKQTASIIPIAPRFGAPVVTQQRSIVPETTGIYDLGTSSRRWAHIQTNALTIASSTTGCVQAGTNGQLIFTGTDCGTGSGGAFATTSADYWILQYGKGFFFSTTSADWWGSTKGYLTSVDISSNTNLAATYPVILTGDTLSFPATSTLYGTGAAGYVLAWANGGPAWQATSTCVQITGSAALCDGDDAAGGGGSAWPLTPTTYNSQAAQSTSTLLWLTHSTLSLVASSSFTTNASTTNLSYTGNLSGLYRTTGSTYWNLQHLMNLGESAGRTSGGVLSDSGSGVAAVTAGTGFIKASDSDTSDLYFTDWAASSTVRFNSATSTLYVGIEYNSGSPRIVTKSTDSWNIDTEFPLGSLFRESGTIYTNNMPWWTGDPIGNILERFDSHGLERDNRSAGLILSNSGTRNVAVSAGNILGRLTEFSISALDTSASGSFDAYYQNGSGGFTKQAAQTQWNNSQYDDGSGTLASITVTFYASRWFYLMTDGSLAMVYGRSQNTALATILNESPPSTVPDRILRGGILIGRFVIQASASTPATTQSAFGTSFTAATVTSHTDLANLAWTSSGHTGTANTVAAFNSAGTAVAYSTSTLFGTGTNGQVLMLSNGTPTWFATSSAAGGVSGGTAGMLTSWVNSTTLTATGTPTFASFYSTSSAATSTLEGNLFVGKGAAFPSLFVGTGTINNIPGGFLPQIRGIFRDSSNDFASLAILNEGKGPCTVAALNALNSISDSASDFMEVGQTGDQFTGVGCTFTGYTGFAADSGYLYNISGDINYAVSAAGKAHKWFTSGTAAGNRVMTLDSEGDLGIASSSPWALLSIASSTYNYTKPLFAIATSSDSFGWLMGVWATTSVLTSLQNPFNRALDSGVRVAIGTTRTYDYPGLLDQVTINGRINTQEWFSSFCEVPGDVTNNNTENACDRFVYAEDGSARISRTFDNDYAGIWYGQICLHGGATNCSESGNTSGSNTGSGLFFPGGAGGFSLSTSTPVLEVVARIEFPQNATNTSFYIGFTNLDTTGGTFEVEPTSGCYFVASSSLANWFAICRTSASVNTRVDTGFASSTVLSDAGAGFNRFSRFRIEMQNGRSIFYIGSSTAPLRQVANITTNVPTGSLKASVYLANINAGLPKSFNVNMIRLWYRQPALNY